MVGLGRFELPTSRLSGVRSNHLSYRPQAHKKALEQQPVRRALIVKLVKIKSFLKKDNSVRSCPFKPSIRKRTLRHFCELPPTVFLLPVKRDSQAPHSFTLHRKEVIQPQVPLQLPCYDFAPVTEFTFGTSLPCGLRQRLRVPSASMA